MKKFIILILTGVSIVSVQGAFNAADDVPDKAALGKLLFFDPILSADRRISCASCHRPEYAFADTSAVSMGFEGRKGVRNTPTAMNVSQARPFFWDGRSKNLEEQALAPIENPDEMNLPIEEALGRLQNSGRYGAYFKKVFNSRPNRTNLAEALAAFERTLETSESPFDEWKFTDDPAAVSNAVKRGFIVFNEKGNCVECHFGSDFTQNEFRNIGLFNGKDLNDSGRVVVSRKAEDIGRFKTPSLRNIAITAPYMHNGMFKTLEEVIDFYNHPDRVVPNAINRDSLMAKPLGLTKQEKTDLKAFLVSLTDKRFDKTIVK